MKNFCVILCFLVLPGKPATLEELKKYNFDENYGDGFPLPFDEKYKTKGLEKLNINRLFPSTTIGRFWHISDFHLDFYYKENAQRSKVCPSSFGSPAIEPGPFGDYRCDSPLSLINSSILAMKGIYPDPDFILWTGDSSLHNRGGAYLSESLVWESITNISSLIQKAFPNIKVFSALGNHDVYPENQMPIGNSIFLNGVAKSWKNWLTPLESATFEDGGFYVGTNDKYTNLEVVVLNTNLWNRRNKAFNVTEEIDPGGQFEFLKSTLEHANDDAKIYIVGHMPPGYFELADDVSWYYPKYLSHYIELVKNYSDKIAGQFFGHHHTDSFRIFKDDKGNSISNLWITPAVTPRKNTQFGIQNGDNNPAIRLFEFDKSTLQPKDYLQFYLDLDKANSDGEAKWLLEYRATSAYQIPDISPRHVGDLLKNLQKADTLCLDCADTLLLNNYTLHNSVSRNDQPCDATCQRRHVCAIHELQAEGYQKCITASANHLRTFNIFWFILFYCIFHLVH